VNEEFTLRIFLSAALVLFIELLEVKRLVNLDLISLDISHSTAIIVVIEAGLETVFGDHRVLKLNNCYTHGEYLSA
jgi:hypothetical protein